MKDRSDDPSHYERTLLPQSLLFVIKSMFVFSSSRSSDVDYVVVLCEQNVTLPQLMCNLTEVNNSILAVPISRTSREMDTTKPACSVDTASEIIAINFKN